MFHFLETNINKLIISSKIKNRMLYRKRIYALRDFTMEDSIKKLAKKKMLEAKRKAKEEKEKAKALLKQEKSQKQQYESYYREICKRI